jgi:hypothetical protein
VTSLSSGDIIVIATTLFAYILGGFIFWVRLGPRVDHLERSETQNAAAIRQLEILNTRMATLIETHNDRLSNIETSRARQGR